ncbi:MAG: membrane dipeptidase [Hyphomonas sp.]|uniref:dipeptidase n=1 Tax=Hyphomonas sp. TaxID=87 RepID=UPI003001866E
MAFSRRNVLKVGAGLSALGFVGACAGRTALASAPVASRRLLINGNMVIPGNSDEPLNDEDKALIRATGITALKITAGGSQGTYNDTLEELESYARVFANNPDVFMQVDSVADIETAFATQRVGIILGFEASTMHEGKTERIAEFAGRGVRIMQLSYNVASPFGTGVMVTEGPKGLTDLGREAIGVMEANRVFLDLSHSDRETTLEAISASSRAPAITHAGCAAVNPHPRNKTDEVLRALADKGGVVGIYELSYLTPDLTQTPLSAYMAHLEHALNKCGEDHVGIGSDALMLAFDTSPESKAAWDASITARREAGVGAPGEGPMPFVEGLNGPQRMSVIADKLALLGYKSGVVDKVMGRNFERIMKQAWVTI